MKTLLSLALGFLVTTIAASIIVLVSQLLPRPVNFGEACQILCLSMGSLFVIAHAKEALKKT